MTVLLTGTMDEAAAELLQATTQLLKQSLRASAEAIALRQNSLIELDGKQYIDVKEEHITAAADAMRAVLTGSDAVVAPQAARGETGSLPGVPVEIVERLLMRNHRVYSENWVAVWCVYIPDGRIAAGSYYELQSKVSEYAKTLGTPAEPLGDRRTLVPVLDEFYNVMDDLKRSQMPHGDCASGARYGGVPKACSACMANLRLKEAVAKYKGRPVRLA